MPERLALIGGSILLASTLVFTLKSQASSIIPNVSHSISGVFDHIGDAQKSSGFDDNFQQAQKDGWTTGQWGSSKYYIDKNMDFHIGQGQLSNTVFNTLGQDKANSLNAITFDQSVQAPENSSGLLAQMQNVVQINGTENLNVSNTTDASWMFAHDQSLKSLNLSDWKLPMLVNGNHMFSDEPKLKSLDISNFDNPKADMTMILGGDWDPSASSLNHLVTGSNTYTRNWLGIPDSKWTDGSQTLDNHQLLTTYDNGTHPGDWHRIE